MKRFLILLPLSLIAADIVDIGELTDRDGIEIHKCHTNDVSLIEVITKNSDKERHSGYFTYTNATIFRNNVVIPMIPTGTNIFRIRTVCAGSTSEVTEVRFVIRRPIPAPVVAKVDLYPAMPPMPPGAAALMPLPGGVNLTAGLHGRKATKMIVKTPSETAEIYSRLAALRRSNEALTNARRRDQELIVELRAEVAKLEHKFERSQMAYECCFSCLKTF